MMIDWRVGDPCTVRSVKAVDEASPGRDGPFGPPPGQNPRADFPHWAPTFGLRASETPLRAGMYDTRWRKRVADVEALRFLDGPPAGSWSLSSSPAKTHR